MNERSYRQQVDNMQCLANQRGLPGPIPEACECEQFDCDECGEREINIILGR